MTQRTDTRVHAALGGITYRLSDLVTQAGQAVSSDPYGTSADRAMADIEAARELLIELELALLVAKADGEAKLKGAA